jgi:hypothetical protein
MLRNIQALRDYIRILESHMEQCSKEHPGSTAHQYLSSRPDSLEEAPESPEEVVNEVVTEEEEEKGDNDVAKELCLPTQSLRVCGFYKKRIVMVLIFLNSLLRREVCSFTEPQHLSVTALILCRLDLRCPACG